MAEQTLMGWCFTFVANSLLTLYARAVEGTGVDGLYYKYNKYLNKEGSVWKWERYYHALYLSELMTYTEKILVRRQHSNINNFTWVYL